VIKLARSNRVRSLARLALVAGCALAQLECGESGRYGVTGGGGGGGGTGGIPTPTAGTATVSILLPLKVPGNTPVNVGDSVLVQFRASSAKKVKEVDLFGVALRGDVNLGTDTTIPRFFSKVVPIAFKTDTIMKRFLFAIPGDSTAETVFIIATVVDSSGNTGADTVTIHVAPGPHVVLTAPAKNAQVSSGKQVTVTIHVTSALGARVVGWRANGVAPVVFAKNDSTIYAATGLPKDTIRTDTLTIPAATATGIIVLTPFAVDSAGNPSGGATPDTIQVSSAASDQTPPLVTFTVVPRVEVDDSITVHATDPSGIKNLGFIVRGLGAATVWAADSSVFGGSQTDVTVTFALGHPAPAVNRGLDTVTAFPQLLTIEAFGVDSVGNRGFSSSPNSPAPNPVATGTAFKDTLTIVAGKTFALPAGGSIGDAIYDKTRNELYLSNQTLNRLEVFQVGTSSFLAGGIPVGSAPLGLALWPHDTLGNYGDTVIVANTGGTNLSIVDVVARAEVRRQRLASYIVQDWHTETNSGGGITIIITNHDFSDRPFAVGAMCVTAGAATCQRVRAVYSTTPTNAQPGPFGNRGYIAWIDLNPGATPGPHNHFMYEHVAFDAGADTLQIIAIFDSIPGQPLRDTVLGAGIGIHPNFADLAFQDSTFVRNSGDFQHALFGEGGPVSFARAITYDSRQGLGVLSGGTCVIQFVPLNCTGTLDKGVTDAAYVGDFVINRASQIHSIAMNFNGRTNFVRADSIYVTDFTLRQTGMMQVGGANAGMDVNPNNTFDANARGTPALNANNRLLYAARPDANIEVFDTYFFGSIALIPVRDPIIGPVRLALNLAGQQVLVGVTASGVVVVPFTPPANIFPVRAAIRAAGH
jgi:hypothetical protein